MKRSHYQIKFENPCAKNWSAGTADTKERFGFHCLKWVSNFIPLTYKRIFKRLSNTKENICSSLGETQAQTEFVHQQLGNKYSCIPKFLIGLLLLISAQSLKANDCKPRIEFEESKTLAQKELSQATSMDLWGVTTDSLPIVLEGQLLNAITKEPLEFANVILEGKKMGTATDENGNFRLVIPDSLIGKKIILLIKSAGYAETRFSFRAKDFTATKKILMIQPVTILMCKPMLRKKKSWWQFWK